MAHEKQLLIVEDDEGFARTLKRSFERRGYNVLLADSLETVTALLGSHRPGFAVVDLKLGPQSGLACVQALHAHDPAMLIVVLTGFASIATAVEAIKLGASYYLAKPSNTDDIEAAFDRHGRPEGVSAIGLARHVQAVLQGSFILAKSANAPAIARESVVGSLVARFLFGDGAAISSNKSSAGRDVSLVSPSATTTCDVQGSPLLYLPPLPARPCSFDPENGLTASVWPTW